MARTFYTDGATIKNIDFPQYPDAAWDWVEGKPKTKDNELFSRVAAVFRVANLSADAIANLPFALVDKRGEDYDVSDDWQNKVGFMPNPREILRLWRMSLFMTGCAYGFLEGNQVKKKLRYIVPTTITPVVNSVQGLVGFRRKVGNETVEYSIKDRRIVYLWRLDHTTELLPSDNTEFKAAMAAAGVLYYADYYVQNFFQRGGIKPTMLMVKGATTPQNMEKIEGVWDKVVHGWYKYLGKVFNADAIETHVIGDGIENLRDSQLHQEKLSDVAMAAGIPLSLLLSNSANYATAQTEYLQWFRDSVTPWANFIADQLNDQLFTPLGLKLDFRPEITDPGQEDEVQRAGAFQAYVNAGLKPSIAAQIVGIELPNGIEYEELDPEPQPEQLQRVEPEPTTDEEEEPEDEITRPAKFIPSLDQVRELTLWQSLAMRKHKRGDTLDFAFVCKTLPDTIADQVRERLAIADDIESVKAAFDVTAVTERHEAQAEEPMFEMAELAEALGRAAEAVKWNGGGGGGMAGVNINLGDKGLEIINPPQAAPIINVPEYKIPAELIALLNAMAAKAGEPTAQPVINVQVPEQPAPNVTVNVEPTPVKVENTIQIPKADKPRKVKVTRNAQGAITGMEAE